MFPVSCVNNGGSNPSSFRNENQRNKGVTENARLTFLSKFLRMINLDL